MHTYTEAYLDERILWDKDSLLNKANIVNVLVYTQPVTISGKFELVSNSWRKTLHQAAPRHHNMNLWRHAAVACGCEVGHSVEAVMHAHSHRYRYDKLNFVMYNVLTE